MTGIVCSRLGHLHNNCLSNAMHGIGQNIKSLGRVRPSGVRGQNCVIIYGPIFTKFQTYLPHIMEKKIFLGSTQ